MKRVVRTMGWILSLPLIAVFICVVFPLALIFETFRIPAKLKRLSSLRNAIKTRWFPAKKYVYLEYNSAGELAKFVENTLLPTYGEHMVVFDLNTWTYRDTAFEAEAKTLANDMLGFDRCDLELAVTTLDPGVLPHTIMLGPEDPRLKAKQQRLIKKIETCLKSHGTLPHPNQLVTKST